MTAILIRYGHRCPPQRLWRIRGGGVGGIIKMQFNDNQRINVHLTDSVAMWLPGLYSVQTIPVDPGDPSLAFYRRTADDAINTVHKLAKTNRHQLLMLHHDLRSWDVYDSSGRIRYLCSSVCSKTRPSSAQPATINYDILDGQVLHMVDWGREAAVNRIAAVNDSSSESAANMSNMIVFCRDVLVSAPAEDLEHIVVIEGAGMPCRVSGIYMDANSVSMRTLDGWLDRYRRMAAHKPLDGPHYRSALAYMLSGVRFDYLRSLLETAADISNVTLQRRESMRKCLEDRKAFVAGRLVDEHWKLFRSDPPGAPETIPAGDIPAITRDLMRWTLGESVTPPRRASAGQ